MPEKSLSRQEMLHLSQFDKTNPNIHSDWSNLELSGVCFSSMITELTCKCKGLKRGSKAPAGIAMVTLGLPRYNDFKTGDKHHPVLWSSNPFCSSFFPPLTSELSSTQSDSGVISGGSRLKREAGQKQ